jgi:hypothetical protein
MYESVATPPPLAKIAKKGKDPKPFPFFGRLIPLSGQFALTLFFLPLSFRALRQAVRPVWFHLQEEPLVQSAPGPMELEPAEAEAVELVLLSYRILLK